MSKSSKSGEKGSMTRKVGQGSDAGEKQKEGLKVPIGQLKFVSYREQLLGCPSPDQPHRRMRRWWLKDEDGMEYAAVETIKFDDETNRYEYAASGEFAMVEPMVCSSHKKVYEYLEKFTGPKESGKRRNSKADGKAGPAEGKRKRKRAGAQDSKGEGKKKEEIDKPVKKRSCNKSNPPGTKKTSNKAGEQILENVSRELAMLQSNYGIRYSLTIIGPHGDVQVLSSPTVTCVDIDPIHVGNGGYPSGLNALYDAVTKDTTDQAEGEGAETSKEQSPMEQSREQDLDENDIIDVKLEGGEKSHDVRDEQPILPGVKTLVKTLKDSEDEQYLGGNFWRRDPFPSIPIKRVLESMRVANDFGQSEDASCLEDFLTLLPLPKAIADIDRFTQAPVPCSPDDFSIQAVWGIDTFTREIINEALSSCKSAIVSREKRALFFKTYFLPALNVLGTEGWDVISALKLIENNPSAPEQFQKAARDSIEVLEVIEETGGTGNEGGQRHQPLRPSGRRYCRSHPKGDGVIVNSTEGVKAGAFVGEYAGEIFMAWRFFERESKNSRINTKSQSLVNSHTVSLERPNIDSKGYYVIYIDVSF